MARARRAVEAAEWQVARAPRRPAAAGASLRCVGLLADGPGMEVHPGLGRTTQTDRGTGMELELGTGDAPVQ